MNGPTQSTPDPLLSFQTVQVSPRWGTAPALDDVIDVVASAGFRAIGLDHWSVDAYLANGGTLAQIGRRLRTNGLVCTDLCALVIGPDAADNLAQARRLAELASVTGASVCATAVSAEVTDPLGTESRSSLNECASVLDAVEVRLAVEYLPYLPLSTVASVAQICDSVGWDRAGVLVDSWATLMGEQLDAVARLDPASIAIVQYSDGVLPAPVDLTDAARNRRMIPGTGNLTLGEFVRVIRRVGYSGSVSTEVLSASERARPLAEFVADLRAHAGLAWRTSINEEHV